MMRHLILLVTVLLPSTAFSQFDDCPWPPDEDPRPQQHEIALETLEDGILIRFRKEWLLDEESLVCRKLKAALVAVNPDATHQNPFKVQRSANGTSLEAGSSKGVFGEAHVLRFGARVAKDRNGDVINGYRTVFLNIETIANDTLGLRIPSKHVQVGKLLFTFAPKHLQATKVSWDGIELPDILRTQQSVEVQVEGYMTSEHATLLVEEGLPVYNADPERGAYLRFRALRTNPLNSVQLSKGMFDISLTFVQEREKVQVLHTISSSYPALAGKQLRAYLQADGFHDLLFSHGDANNHKNFLIPN